MISIVIPTLQKRADLLENLIKTLNNDKSVGEIIVIDNSTKGLSFSYDKLKVITPKENLYVNPSWNLGTREAKFEYVGLLNDDIIMCENFCTQLLTKLENLKDFGVLGFSKSVVEPVDDILNPPEQKEIEFVKADYIDSQFGIAMFYRKDNFPEIPEDMKIWYGDCYIFDKFKENNFQNYFIIGQKVFHYGSLTTSSKNLNPLYKVDKKIWKKIKYKWYDYIFSVEEYSDCKKLRILGLNIRFLNK